MVMATDFHRAALDEVQAEISQLRTRLDTLQAVAEYHSAKLEQVKVNAAPRESHPWNGHDVRYSNQLKEAAASASRVLAAHLTQRQAALAALQSAQKPLRATDIAQAIVKMGYPAPEKMSALANSLFTSMKRDPKRFRKAGAGLWEAAVTAETDDSD